MTAETKGSLIKAGITVISLGALVFGINAIINKLKRNKEEATARLLQEGLGGESSANTIEEEQAQNYNPAADLKLFEDRIHGANFKGYEKPIEKLINSKTNAQLRKLDAAHKSKHNGESLYAALDDEWSACGFWGFSKCYSSVMNRLSSLDLR